MGRILMVIIVPVTMIMVLSGLCGCSELRIDQTSAKQITEYKGHLIIGGSSAGSPPIKLLTDAFSKKYPGVTFEYRPGSKTSAALKQVKLGAIDIGIIAREMKPEEMDPRLRTNTFLYDPIAIVVNKNIPIEQLTLSQLKDIYSGKIEGWDKFFASDSPIILCDRSEDETAKIAMRKFAFGDDLVISDHAINLETENDMLNAVSNTPHSIGYFSMARALKTPNIRIVKLDGIEPSIPNVRDGAYKIIRPVGIVTSKSSTALNEFINFAYSDGAKELLVKNGFMPFDEQN